MCKTGSSAIARPTDPNFSPYYEFTYTFKAVGRC